MSPSAQEFLDALRSAASRWGGVKWLAGRVDGDAIVVLFRQDVIRGSTITSGPVQGTLLQFEEIADAILGSGPHDLDDVLREATLEIVEPHAPGEGLQVSWANGLCAEPEAVLWRPDAIAASRDRA